MASLDPRDVEVTLTHASAIVHAVADALAGRCVQLTWSSTPTEDVAGNALGVTSTAVEVVGCGAADGLPVKVTGVRADDDQFVVVAWSDLLRVGRRVGGDLSPSARDQLTVVSRWVRHTVEITTHAGRRLTENVIGFEYAEEDDGDLNVLNTPNDHVRNPQFNEYAIPLGELDTILDWGT